MTLPALILLEKLGQSIWLDYIKRDLISSGDLKRLIQNDGLSGITSNPSIFEKAIAESQLYDDDIQSMTRQGKSVNDIYDVLTQKDVSDAAQEFKDLYYLTESKDGYVSLEVNPYLAHDTEGTLEEARRLWVSLNHPNILIKVPATREGLPVIKQLISEGINVNVTLIFGLPRYFEVIEAYLQGLEAAVEEGTVINRVASVASFFLSRIDTTIDNSLEKIIQQGGEKAEIAQKIRGQTAIAAAKLAYERCMQIKNSKRFEKLLEYDAQIQRLLWASTGTKNPAYSDIKYIETLIGPETVNTVPVETLDAYRDHGQPKSTLTEGMDDARKIYEQLPLLDIDIDKITQQLEDEGIEKFKKSFDQLCKAIQTKMNA